MSEELTVLNPKRIRNRRAFICHRLEGFDIVGFRC